MKIIEENLTTVHRFQTILSFLNDLKRSFITSSTPSLIMISMLLPLECITRSSSLCLEEIKLIAIATWSFHGSGETKVNITWKDKNDNSEGVYDEFKTK